MARRVLCNQKIRLILQTDIADI